MTKLLRAGQGRGANLGLPLKADSREAAHGVGREQVAAAELALKLHPQRHLARGGSPKGPPVHAHPVLQRPCG